MHRATSPPTYLTSERLCQRCKLLRSAGMAPASDLFVGARDQGLAVAGRSCASRSDSSFEKWASRTWIYGELLKLCTDAGQTTVAKYMAKHMRQSGAGRSLWVSLWLAALIELSVSRVSAAELKAVDFALMDRLTWGVTPSSAEHLKSIGTDRWIEEQLHPQRSAGLPPSVQSQIAAYAGRQYTSVRHRSRVRPTRSSRQPDDRPRSEEGASACLSADNDGSGPAGGRANRPACALRAGSPAPPGS
jgi:hypothetical protein